MRQQMNRMKDLSDNFLWGLYDEDKHNNQYLSFIASWPRYGVVMSKLESGHAVRNKITNFDNEYTSNSPDNFSEATLDKL